MPKLYELAIQYRALQDAMEDGEAEEFAEALQQLQGDPEEKAENVAMVIRLAEADCDIIKAEEKRLADRRRVLENRARGLRDYLVSEMEYAHVEKIKRPLVTISLQQNPARVEVAEGTNVSLFPPQWVRYVPARWEPDKKGILDVWKLQQQLGANAGQYTLPNGVTIITGEKRVVIR